jgi:hypothetical protein
VSLLRKNRDKGLLFTKIICVVLEISQNRLPNPAVCAAALKIFWHQHLIYATIKLIFRAREQKIFEVR